MAKPPKYTMIYPRAPHWRGDVVDGFELQISDEGSSQPVVPTSVCCQIRDEAGDVVYSYAPIIFPDGKVVFEAVTANWVAGLYAFDVEYTMGGGKKRTYVTGTLPIMGDVSKC